MLIEAGAAVGVCGGVCRSELQDQGTRSSVPGERILVMMIDNSNNNDNSKWLLSTFDGLQTPGTF